MGWLTIVYLASFILGLTFTVGAFLMSGLDRFSRFQTQGRKRKFNSWLNFNASAVLLTWFGAAGFIFRSLKTSEEVTLALAILSGLAGYTIILIYAFRQTEQKDPTATSLTGTVARVSQNNKDGSEIVFYTHGLHMAAPARPVDGGHLIPGTQVVILRQEKGIALVEDLDRFLIRTGAGKWSTTKLKSAGLKDPRS
jgi:hypothetical protein